MTGRAGHALRPPRPVETEAEAAPAARLAVVPRRGEVSIEAPTIPPPDRGAPDPLVDAAVAPPGADDRTPAPRRSSPRSSRVRASLAALVLHAVVLAAVVGRPVSEPTGGGEALLLAVEFVAPETTDTVDAAAAATASEPARETEQPPPASPEATVVDAEPVAPPPETPPAPVASPTPPLATPTPIALPPPTAAASTDGFSEPPPATTLAPAAPSPRRDPPSAPPRAKASAARTATKTEAKRARAAPSPGAAAVERRAGGGVSTGAAAGAAGELRSWRAAVLAALARAKIYPEEARALGRTGRAAVSFTIRRDGDVVAVALAASSGVGSLDAATLALPRRARFPPMPADAGASQTFTAGVRYDLR